MRFLGDVHGVFVIGQNGNGEGITQREDGFGCGAVAAEIVDNDASCAFAGFPLGFFVPVLDVVVSRVTISISSAGTPACEA